MCLWWCDYFSIDLLAVVILLLSVLVMCGADCGQIMVNRYRRLLNVNEYYHGHEFQMS